MLSFSCILFAAFAGIDEPRKWRAHLREPFERIYGSKELERLLSEYGAARERIYLQRTQPFSAIRLIAARREQRASSALGSRPAEADTEAAEAEAACEKRCVARALAEGGLAGGGWTGEVVRARLPLVRCPVLVLQGGRDALVHPFHPKIIAREVRHSRCAASLISPVCKLSVVLYFIGLKSSNIIEDNFNNLLMAKPHYQYFT